MSTNWILPQHRRVCCVTVLRRNRCTAFCSTVALDGAAPAWNLPCWISQIRALEPGSWNKLGLQIHLEDRVKHRFAPLALLCPRCCQWHENSELTILKVLKKQCELRQQCCVHYCCLMPARFLILRLNRSRWIIKYGNAGCSAASSNCAAVHAKASAATLLMQAGLAAGVIFTRTGHGLVKSMWQSPRSYKSPLHVLYIHIPIPSSPACHLQP